MAHVRGGRRHARQQLHVVAAVRLQVPEAPFERVLRAQAEVQREREAAAGAVLGVRVVIGVLRAALRRRLRRLRRLRGRPAGRCGAGGAGMEEALRRGHSCGFVLMRSQIPSGFRSSCILKYRTEYAIYFLMKFPYIQRIRWRSAAVR